MGAVIGPLGLLCAALLLVGRADGAESVWAHRGYTGRMIYLPDAEGDRICDFSMVGYKQGKSLIPDVPVKATVAPGQGDATARIQAAIDQVAAMHLVNGFRGAVLLKAGSYDIQSQLKINASGIVLRGEGQGDNGTILHARGTNRRDKLRFGGLIDIDGTGNRKLIGSKYGIIDKVVPAGMNSLRVDSTAGLHVGDMICIIRPSTARWIADVGMNRIPGYPWNRGSVDLEWERTIIHIEGNRVFLDAPVTNALEKKYGGATVQKCTFPGRIENVGVENLRGESDFKSDKDEEHCWDFIDIYRAQHVWVRDTTARYFADSHVQIDRYAKWVTVADCTSEMPKSQITGNRRYTYDIHGQQSLVVNCRAMDGRHDFVSAGQVAGPNVFYNCRAIKAHAESEPHMRWDTGELFDNVMVQGDKFSSIAIQNRWTWSDGAGWTGANLVIWNCTARGYKVQSPPTAQNWLIGSRGRILPPDFSTPLGNPPPYIDSLGVAVATKSLYLAQLADAGVVRDYPWKSGSGDRSNSQKRASLAEPAARTIETRDYLIGDVDGLTNDHNADDDYYVDPAFKSQMESQHGSKVGGFDAASTGRDFAFTQRYRLSSSEQVVNAWLALAIRPADKNWSNDVLTVGDVGTCPLKRLKWGGSKAGSQIIVGLVDLGAHLKALQGGKLNVAIHGNTAVDFALLSLQVAHKTDDSQGASVTLSGGGSGGAGPIDSAVAQASSAANLATTPHVDRSGTLPNNDREASSSAIRAASGFATHANHADVAYPVAELVEWICGVQRRR